MRIDLRSDTVTRPTPAMRRAMAEAEVGDDVLDGDPTVIALEERVARMLGKERALFFPSGTMANQAAIWVLSRPGTELVLDAEAHIVQWELAGASALSGVQPRPVRGADGGVLDAAALEAALRPRSPFLPAVGLVAFENTHNGAGGRVTPLDELRAMAELVRERGLPSHLDGARLWNAGAASDTPVAAFARCADTVMVSFSKGLGAPVGAALAGDDQVIAAARTARKRFGGGMRQSGILAAAVLHALDHHLDGLARDHEHARLYAGIVDGVCGARVVPPDTNIVMLDLPPGVEAAVLVSTLARDDVLLSPWSATRVRAVMHRDVDADMVRTAAERVAAVVEEIALRED